MGKHAVKLGSRDLRNARRKVIRMLCEFGATRRDVAEWTSVQYPTVCGMVADMAIAPETGHNYDHRKGLVVNPERLARVKELTGQDVRQADIAKELGVTRQSVSLYMIHHNIRRAKSDKPYMHQPLHERRARKAVARMLCEFGATRRDVAEWLGLSHDTVIGMTKGLGVDGRKHRSE